MQTTCAYKTEYWLARALDDIWSFELTDHDAHMQKIKNSYFTENGWKQFRSVYHNIGHLRYSNPVKYEVIPFVGCGSGITIKKDSKSSNKASARVLLPLCLKIRPKEANSDLAGHQYSFLLDVRFSGPVDQNLKISTDGSGTRPQYLYKIDGYNHVPDSELKAVIKGNRKPFWQRMFSK